MTFNPSAPTTIGNEAKPTARAAQLLDGPTTPGSLSLVATANEDIAQAAVFIDSIAQANADTGSGWEMEVYDMAALGASSTETQVFLPGQDNTDRFYNVQGQLDPSTPILSATWQAIDSYPAPLVMGSSQFVNGGPGAGHPTHSPELIFPIFGAEMEACYRFTGTDGATANRRITRVTLHAMVAEYVAYAFVAGMQITPYLMINGARFPGAAVSVQGESPNAKHVAFDWYANPATGCSWRASDIAKFDAATGEPTWAAGWLVAATGSSNNLATILQGWLEIETTTDTTDPRVAVGCLRPDELGWSVIDLANPLTGAVWSKVAGHEYLVTLRRRAGEGKIGWRYITGDPDMPDHMPERDVQYAVQNLALVGVGDEKGQRRYTLALIRDDGDVSEDSQPYASVNGDAFPALGIANDWTTIDTSHTLSQLLTPSTSDTFSWLRALVALRSGETTDPLTIQVTDTSGVSVGSALVVQPGDLDDAVPRTLWQLIEGKLAGATLASGTTYRLRFSSPAPIGQGWRVQVLSAYLESSRANTPTGIGVATARGSADRARVGTVEHSELDLAATIATQPDPPANLGVTVAAHHLGAPWDAITVDWDPTALGADFYAYEVERSLDAGLTWHRIADVLDEATTAILDDEARFGASAAYRVRVRRADRSASDWAAEVVTTLPVPACGYVLSSNTASALAMWAADSTDERGTRKLTPLNETTTRRFAGRDYSVGFQSLSFSGVSFTRTLLLAADGAVSPTPEPPANPLDAFAPLLALLASRGAALPYVCVRDEKGGRWLCTLSLGEWTVEGVGGACTADVTFTEATDRPYAVQIGG